MTHDTNWLAMGIQSILRGQYSGAMDRAYSFAQDAIWAAPNANAFLDCGCGSGDKMGFVDGRLEGRPQASYTGLEWSQRLVDDGRAAGLNLLLSDLNKLLPIASDSQDCVAGLSVFEHILMPCHFLTECRRVLRSGGRLVLLTPNISTYFTALLILAGRMPSSGPHPDSNSLMKSQELVRVTASPEFDMSGDQPEHRHLVVFSYLALRRLLLDNGFSIQHQRGFGYYPFPKAIQPFFERLDPYHCHQMVFVATKL